jgi:ABC-type branched-subunit amino acid transport system substrate-binding protein
MKKKTLLIPLALLLVVSLIAIGCADGGVPDTPDTPDTPTEPEILQLGAIVNMTGFLGGIGSAEEEIREICVDLMNEMGGITVDGQQYLVEVISEDAESSLEGTGAAATRLVFDKGVKFLYSRSPFSVAAATVTEPAQVLRLTGWCNLVPGDVDATTPYGFANVYGTIPSVVAMIKFVQANYPEVERVAYIAPNHGLGEFYTPQAIELMEAAGITVVGDPIYYPNDMIDFSPIASKVLSLDDIDAVFQVNGINEHVGAILKGLREGGCYVPFATNIQGRLDEVVAIAGVAAAENTFNTTPTYGDPDNPPLVQEIFQRVVDKYGEDHVLFLKSANDLWIFKAVIEGAQSLDPTVVKEWWESIDELDTLLGTGIMCGEETYGIKHLLSQPISIQWVKDGQVVSGGWIDVGYIP